jgi:hypothetical protein
MKRIGSLSALVGEKKSATVKFSPKKLQLASTLDQHQEFPENLEPRREKEAVREGDTDFFEVSDIRIPQSSVNPDFETSVLYRKRSRDSADNRGTNIRPQESEMTSSGRVYGSAGGNFKKQKGQVVPKSSQSPSPQQEAKAILPVSFGGVTNYSIHTVYLKKKESVKLHFEILSIYLVLTFTNGGCWSANKKC